MIALIVSLAFLPVANAKEFYEGGTLHDSTLQQWSESDDSNKIATSADWITTVLGQDQVIKVYSKLQFMSAMVVNCVDTLIPVVAESWDINTEKTASIGAMCITTFSNKDWKEFI